ncbi:MAG TPA: methylated-DNA--[protein]-cysteine S-methyltransferase [Nocardioidaceae bacterium]|jgi:methylated-DNA-[protein]-cysteine S-methyltransferase|nr:methylated-DNA--[protein]-cysteine S-methyltransferase [Nocardioidaceae bacterium]
MTRYWTALDSPVGGLVVVAEGDAITAVSFSEEPPVDAVRDDDLTLLRSAREQLASYFAGERRDFDVPLALRGTPFQQRVWAALRHVPYGQTTGYGAIAAQLGLSRGSARAVGSANGANPVAIVVPCHRVIGASGKLVGYAGGLDRKRTLLALEAPGLFSTV